MDSGRGVVCGLPCAVGHSDGEREFAHHVWDVLSDPVFAVGGRFRNLYLCIHSDWKVSILIGNKAVVAVVCLLLAMALMLQGVMVSSWLDEPESYTGMYMDDSGTMQIGEPKPNPNYMPEGSPQRKVCEFLNDFIPGGQSIQIMGSINEMARFCVYDLAWILVVSTFGVLIFRRKDLK